MKGIKYIGPIWDFSGYAEASRNYVLALHRAGVPVTVQPHCFDRNAPPVGSDQERATLQSLVNKPIDYDIVIVHLTPDLAPLHAEANAGKYIISYTVWETSKLHPLWVDACNKVNEVWVPSQWNIDSFKNSGVTVPILKVPHGIDPDLYAAVDPDLLSAFGTKDTFNFYSIFQWNARKNPEGLLRSYYNAFQGKEDVRLILKTYIGGNVPGHEEIRLIKEAVTRVKNDMRLPHYPKLSLITETLSSDQMHALHMFGDAYVAIPYGEGWGLGFMEAGLAGKPVIGTGAGGNMEFMAEENSFPVQYMETFVGGMGTFNPWYLGDQRWFQPSMIDAAAKMAYVYNNREEAKARGEKLRQRISQEFNWDAVASIMISRLKEINA
jgi:glycosyltransferase involved in cell wall biosynthesis